MQEGRTRSNELLTWKFDIHSLSFLAFSFSLKVSSEQNQKVPMILLIVKESRCTNQTVISSFC